VADRLFEGEEAVLHAMGIQIASWKRRNPWTSARVLLPIRSALEARNAATRGHLDFWRSRNRSWSERRCHDGLFLTGSAVKHLRG
jgi:hypothetical protein